MDRQWRRTVADREIAGAARLPGDSEGRTLDKELKL